MSSPAFFSSDTRRTEYAWTDWPAVSAFVAERHVCRIAVHDTPWPYVVGLAYDFADDAFMMYFSRRGKLADLLGADPHCTIEIDEPLRIYRESRADNIAAEYRSVIARCLADLSELELPPVSDEKKTRRIYACRAQIVQLSAKKRILAEGVAP